MDDLVDYIESQDEIEPGEREMVRSVFELGDTIVREVMVPRTDMVFIEHDKTVGQALSLALRSGFSRIPVTGENTDDVVGIGYLKDMVAWDHEHPGTEHTERVDKIMRPATYVPESKPVDELLRQMQVQRIHVAIVIDEYGGTAGLVTIEDILEEIVGEIADEYDNERAPVEWLGPGTARVIARLPVTELEELFGVTVEAEDVETVGGLLAPRARPRPHRGLRGDGGRPAPDRRERGRPPQPARHRPDRARPGRKNRKRLRISKSSSRTVPGSTQCHTISRLGGERDERELPTAESAVIDRGPAARRAVGTPRHS